MAAVQKRSKKPDVKSQNSKSKEVESRQDEQDLGFIPLSLVEISLYWIVWIPILGYVMFKVYQASNDYKDYLYPEDFGEGWKIIGRSKDVTDMEWEFWSKFKLVLLVAFSLHAIGGLVTAYFFPKLKAWFYLLYTLGFLTVVLGIPPVLYLLAHCVIMYLCSLTRSAILVWGFALAILASLQLEMLREWQFQYLTDKQEYTDFTLFVALMSILRCLSFALDCCWRSKDKESTPSDSFFDLLSFNFYLPLFNNGPVMTYDSFHRQFHQPQKSFTKQEILSIVWDSFRTFWWYIFLEIYLHFFYSSALAREAPLYKSLSGWTLSGIIYSQLHIFLTKYVVLYRFSGVFARLDGLDPPGAPRCVSTLYTFTDMWRYFDRGLNVWMKRYIYIPLGGSRRGIFRQFLASFLAFGFVWAWHGANQDTMWWFIPNWLGVAAEGIASVVIKQPQAKKLQECLSPRMRRRVHAAICIIPCASLIMSNMVFLIGPRPVWFYIYKIFYQDFPVSTLVCFSCLYLSIQTNIDLNYYKGGKW